MFSYRKAKHRIFHLLNVLRIYFINTKGGNLSFSTKLDKKTKVYISRGANIKTGINVYLRSEPRGYHCGMPFGTVLLADKKELISKLDQIVGSMELIYMHKLGLVLGKTV